MLISDLAALKPQSKKQKALGEAGIAGNSYLQYVTLCTLMINGIPDGA